VILAYPATAPQAAATASLVRRLRSTVIPRATAGTGLTVLVGGETASGIDASSYLSQRLPLVIGAVILVSFVMLMVVLRSVVVPVTAAVMNLLSIGAAYDGLAATGRVITAAAAIMVCVFGSFVVGDPVRILGRVRPRAGGRHPGRRRRGPPGPGSLGHATARPGQLVVPYPAFRAIPRIRGATGQVKASGGNRKPRIRSMVNTWSMAARV
jgi:hypothetical protein